MQLAKRKRANTSKDNNTAKNDRMLDFGPRVVKVNTFMLSLLLPSQFNQKVPKLAKTLVSSNCPPKKSTIAKTSKKNLFLLSFLVPKGIFAY